ncbi:ATP-dependent RNA helicase [Actinobaculum suis]|uniref:ATP-dependent RNA helicase n=1 Tax=Actinobaculum suis TaxID=1657 RepID=A0A7Z8Y7E5_9ACTO|nr:DEAD/DEAH box helicase [Actinobaculum suis]VDG75448.1 ATP-dependent RNA helicase [Actinobaculum suis]
MAMLNPIGAAKSIEAGISEYLTSSFTLNDPATSQALEDFLTDPVDGMFHGPFIRVRLPYQPAPENGTSATQPLSWLPEGFQPYSHQARAFARLRSDAANPSGTGPQPTIVATGTGSGKTEAFLYPIIDHALRARNAGIGGIKAIIIYPMNALAADQESRLARLLAEDKRLHGLRGGIYTGATTQQRQRATSTHLISSRAAMRVDPPDILLTNYKMLDQLLLRDDDQPLWELSAQSLQYIVLDEFHTYDGAQGTDVALLLRRLGLRLRDFAPDRFPDPHVPLGPITPVATSATLGDKASEVLDFAHTVFGTPFPDSALIGENLMDYERWSARLRAELAANTATSTTPDTAPNTATAGRAENSTPGAAPDAEPLASEFDAAAAREAMHKVCAAMEAFENGTAANTETADPGELRAAFVQEIFARHVLHLPHLPHLPGASTPEASAAESTATPSLAETSAAPWPEELLRAYALHPLFKNILQWAARPAPLRERPAPLPENDRRQRWAVPSLTERFVAEYAIPARSENAAGESLPELFMGYALEFMASLRAVVTAADSPLRLLVPGVETHLWIREVSRVDRLVGEPEAGEKLFRWSDDGPLEESNNTATWLPACYCRHCGRAGWMGSLRAGSEAELVEDATEIRRSSAQNSGKQRPLMDAQAAAGQAREEGRAFAGVKTSDATSCNYWLDAENKHLLTSAPSEEDIQTARVVPVVTYAPHQDSEERANKEICPSCGEPDSIRYIGSSIATLLSVALSNLFGLPELDASEKKTLVFTDSVQDAAHRAAFVQDRSHVFTFRGLIYQAIPEEGISLTELTRQMMDRTGKIERRQVSANSVAGKKQKAHNAQVCRRRYELLPAHIAKIRAYRPYWEPDTEADRSAHRKAERFARERISFDVAQEFGQRSHLPRSLMLTGTAGAFVDATEPSLLAAAQAAVAGLPETLEGFEISAETLIQWARGFLEIIRERGGIYHRWLDSYLKANADTYLLNRRSARSQGIPTFPPGGGPEFPRAGRPFSNKAAERLCVSPLASPQGRYARWTARQLHIKGLGPHEASRCVVELAYQLAERGLLRQIRPQNARAYNPSRWASHPHSGTPAGADAATSHQERKEALFALDPDLVIAERTETATRPEGASRPRPGLECDTCRSAFAVAASKVPDLVGMACPVADCDGYLRQENIADGYYANLYTSRSPRTVMAAEHSSLLSEKERAHLETQFKGKKNEPAAPDAPNVLVATPTLEMGIDIGDLSTVFLSSLPKTVANYQQRVGRAGRKTGNSLAVTLSRGRGETLPKIAWPLSMIDGDVTAPTAFLRATAIVERQFLARLLDTMEKPGVRHSPSVFGYAENNLVPLIQKRIGAGIEGVLNDFLATLSDFITPEDAQRLRAWATGNGPRDLIGTLTAQQLDWAEEQRSLTERIEQLKKLCAELEPLSASEQATLQRQEGAAAAGKETGAQIEYRTANANLRHAMRLRVDRNEEYWISGMERTGLLPNFTLLDDSVELSVGISRVDEETQKREIERRDYTRGAAQALQELAPGASFYAQGIRADITAVDLGPESSRIEQWHLCPSCSYSERDTGTNVSRVCPACGDTKWNDAGQRAAVVQLRKVSADADGIRNAIGDDRDERRVTVFHTVLTCNFDSARVSRNWYTNKGFGVQVLPQVDLRWLNLGRGSGEKIAISGQEYEAPGFRVCPECGHEDSNDRTNHWYDHRPWCSLRSELNLEPRTIFLGRELTTQGVLLRIPKFITRGDNEALPSLIAALRLGFREVIGGDPDNLDISAVRVPSQASTGVTDALLLHDVVPGGTGYLMQFEQPGGVWNLLYSTWQRLRNCDCGEDGRRCCTNCLLPYTLHGQIHNTSRYSAQASLIKLLTDNPAADLDTEPPAEGWDEQTILEEEPEPDPASELEVRFREYFRQGLQDRNIASQSTINSHGQRTITFQFPGQTSTWHMREQEILRDSNILVQPDFFFEATDWASGDREPIQIAVFTDGYAFHKQETFADDIRNRHALHDYGIIPWTITWADLDWYQEVRETGGNTANHRPEWYYDVQNNPDPNVIGNQELEQVITADPLSQLFDLLRNPNLQRRQVIATRTKLEALVSSNLDSVQGGGASPLPAWKRRVVLPKKENSNNTSGSPVVISLEGVNSDGSIADAFEQEDWAIYHHLLNLFYTSTNSITVRFDDGAELFTQGAAFMPDLAPVPEPESDSWDAAFAEYEGEPDVVEALDALRRAGVAAPEMIGEEIGGIPTVASWLGRIFLAFAAEDIPASAAYTPEPAAAQGTGTQGADTQGAAGTQGAGAQGAQGANTQAASAQDADTQGGDTQGADTQGAQWYSLEQISSGDIPDSLPRMGQ